MSPAVRGVVQRRLLVNYRADVGTLGAVLPEPFVAREVGESGDGIGSVCFTKVRGARTRLSPSLLGVSAEVATHRVSAVCETESGTEACAYVPRRDVSSRSFAFLWNLTMPADLKIGVFRVVEDGCVYVRVRSAGEHAGVEAHESEPGRIPSTSVFGSVEEASEFFRDGGIEYTPSGDRYDGVEPRPREWELEPVEVREAISSFFEDLDAEFDSAFRMGDIRHEWRPRRPVQEAPKARA
jgi:hypothetical protein